MKTRIPDIPSGSRAIEVTFHRFTSSRGLVAIPELNEEIQPDEATHREKWKKFNKATVTLDDVPLEVVNHPSKLTFLTFWSSSTLVLLHWHMGVNGILFPNLGWAEGRTFRCAWKQKPPLKAAILEDGIGIGVGEPVFTSVEEAIVIGRDVFTNVGGCGDMLSLMLVKEQNMSCIGMRSSASRNRLGENPQFRGSIRIAPRITSDRSKHRSLEP